MSNTHKIEGLTNAATKMLRDVLNGTGWSDGWGDIAVAGELLSDIIPEPPLEPVEPFRMTATQDIIEKFKADHNAWSNATVATFELTDKQRDNCRKALKHFADKKAIPGSKHSLMLGRKFGLIE